MENRNWSTFVQVRHNQLVKYDRPDEGFRVPAWRKPPTKKGYSGTITDSTRKRIETAVDIFLQLAPKRRIYNPITDKHQDFQLSFITLTVSAHNPVPASEGHKALKVWLQHFKRPWHRRKMSEPIFTYLWKCELQKRGQIHYHLTTNSFLHLVEIRRVWNDLQKARGWLDDYHRQTGKWDANSTDVHSVYRVKDVRRYLSKYIAKQQYEVSPADPEAGFPALWVPVTLDAKVWGCSEDLKGKKRFSEKLDKWTHISIESGKMSGMLKEYETEHCKFLDVKTKEFQTVDFLSTQLRQDYENWKK
jgi:hypothetical protein